jgi:hypothetical protein
MNVLSRDQQIQIIACLTEGQSIRANASQLPPGVERDTLLKKASRADTAAHLEEWANSPGLQPPK